MAVSYTHLYPTLEAAIEEAEDGDTITLLSNTEVGGIRLDKSLIFDLSGNLSLIHI